MLSLLEHPSSPPVFSGVRVTRSSVLYVCFVDHCLRFFFWPLCCLLLRYTDSDYPFGIFKLFLTWDPYGIVNKKLFTRKL
jgi:hypothetical protein